MKAGKKIGKSTGLTWAALSTAFPHWDCKSTSIVPLISYWSSEIPGCWEQGLRLFIYEAVNHSTSKSQKSAEVVVEGEENLEWTVEKGDNNY